MVRIHIHGESTGPLDLLHLSLGTGGAAQVLQLPNDPQHGGERNLTHSQAETLVRAKAKVNILAHITVQFDLLRVGECLGVMACSHLGRSAGQGIVHRATDAEQAMTYQVTIYRLASLQGHLFSVIVKDGGLDNLPWQRKRRSDSCAFHKANIARVSGVLQLRRNRKQVNSLSQKQLICLGRVLLRQALNFGKMSSVFFLKVKVQALNK